MISVGTLLTEKSLMILVQVARVVSFSKYVAAHSHLEINTHILYVKIDYPKLAKFSETFQKCSPAEP